MSTDNDNSDAFEQRTRELLKRDADDLDPRIRSRLAQARIAAVEESRKSRMWMFWRSWAPLGAVAGAAAIAVMLWTGSGRNPHAPGSTAQSPLEDLELMTADENLEMIEELEFYAWMSAEGADTATG